MGKAIVQEDHTWTSATDYHAENANFSFSRSWRHGLELIHGIVQLRCLFMILLSGTVLLSVLFFLPPSRSLEGTVLNPDSLYQDHEVVASFNIIKSVSFLKDNIWQLERDIFYEIGFPSTKVVILSLKPLDDDAADTATTKVVFGIDPVGNELTLSPTALSLIRASFEGLVVNQSSLRLSNSLLGKPFFFEVLKFHGGIAVTPPQNAFLLQKVQILFNFTLNFSIRQIQDNFAQLTSQLKNGLHLSFRENVYVTLLSSKGSTVSPPTVVQSSVLLAVGNTPSVPRLKQLAQTITGQSWNLGLNNTVFGRVKEVQLSSILQHSLTNSHDSHNSAPSSSPSPSPSLSYHHHRPQHSATSPAMAPISSSITISSSSSSSPAPSSSSPAPSSSSQRKSIRSSVTVIFNIILFGELCWGPW